MSRATLADVMRPRSGAAGPTGPARRRSLLPLLPLLALVVVGCIGAGQATPPPAVPSGEASAAASPSSAASPIAPSATPTPTASKPVAPSATPTDSPSATPDEPPTASGNVGPAEVCAGNDDNRDFYRSVAADVDWPVYCPVLSSGWFVTAGTYRLAGGGWMEIAYRGPGGARLELHEGAFCQDADGCVPAGSDAGSAPFGDLSGALVTGDDGSFSIVVDRGADRSWLAIGTGLDVDAFRSMVASLNHIEG